MNLFHPRVIKRIVENAPDSIPEEHSRILADWAATIETGSILRQSEVSLHGHFTQRILMEVLGYEGFGNRDTWTLQHEQQIGSGSVDVALGRFSNDAKEIIAPFELKSAKTRDLDAVMSGRKKTPVQQAWEYAMDAPGARWVLVSNYIEIRLYAVGYGRAAYESFDLRDLDNPNEYARFQELLSAKHLLGGYTLQLLKESESAEEEITNALYSDYHDLRAKIFQQLREAHPEQEPRRILRLVQTILDRVLFVAFAEDTGLLPPKTLGRTLAQHNPYAPVPVWQNFLGLFAAIDKGKSLEIDGARVEIPAYNGGLFQYDEEIANLRVSDELCEAFTAIGRYEFASDVSVDVLGHILEQSITDLEELQAAADEVDFDDRVSRRRTEGVYYTPKYVTRYLIEKTVGLVLERKKRELGLYELPELTDDDFGTILAVKRGRDRGSVRYNNNIAAHIEFWSSYKACLGNIKILDPACGSGAFLIAAFDFLLAEGNQVNAELTNLRGGQQELFRWEKQILQNNLFGVDINSESIEITKLSLWLKTANPREPLTYLDDNIRVGNSVVDDRELAPRDAFVWEEFGAGTFDVVVANPPYVSALELSRHYGKKAKRYWKSRFESATGAYDLYVLFMELALLLVRQGGYVGLITPNKYLAAPYGVGIRKFIRRNAQLCEVLDLSAAGVFQDPSVYPIVTILRLTTDNNAPTGYAERDAGSGRIATVRELPARTLSALPNAMFSLVLSASSDVLSDVLQRCRRLQDVAEVNATSTAAEADMLSQRIIEHVPGATPLVNTGTIDRFQALWGVKPLTAQRKVYTRPAIKLDEVELSKHRRHIYDSPKIVFAKMALRPEAFLDASGEYCSINTNCVFDSELPLEYLLGILTSTAMAFFYDQFFGSLRMSGGYLQFQAPQLRTLPVPDASDELVAEIADRVSALVSQANQLVHLKRDFIGLLVADFGLGATTRKIGRFESLTWKQFVSEIEQKGAELRGAAREDWHARFQERTAAIRELQNSINSLDQTVDGLVFAAYGLDDEAASSIRGLVDS